MSIATPVFTMPPSAMRSPPSAVDEFPRAVEREEHDAGRHDEADAIERSPIRRVFHAADADYLRLDHREQPRGDAAVVATERERHVRRDVAAERRHDDAGRHLRE